MSALPAAWLFVPGNRPERFAKAAAAGAGAIILDLEDAVAPDQKDAARLAVQDYLAERASPGPVTAVRMNPLGTVSGVADLVMLAGAGADHVILPKAECSEELALLGRVLANGASPGRIVALALEHAASILHLIDTCRYGGSNL